MIFGFKDPITVFLKRRPHTVYGIRPQKMHPEIFIARTNWPRIFWDAGVIPD